MAFTLRSDVNRDLNYSEADGNWTELERLYAEILAARDIAVSDAIIYPDTTAGLAATAEGGYFVVLDTATDELVYYREESGVAVEKIRVGGDVVAHAAALDNVHGIPAGERALHTGDTLSVTLNIPHTWAVAGEVKVPAGGNDVIPGFFVPTLAAGQTAKLVEARHKIGAGTSATVKLQRNGADITGFTAMSVTTTAALTNPAGAALAAGDYIQPVVTGVSGTPKDLTLTVALEYVGA